MIEFFINRINNKIDYIVSEIKNKNVNLINVFKDTIAFDVIRFRNDFRCTINIISSIIIECSYINDTSDDNVSDNKRMINVFNNEIDERLDKIIKILNKENDVNDKEIDIILDNFDRISRTFEDYCNVYRFYENKIYDWAKHK